MKKLLLLILLLLQLSAGAQTDWKYTGSFNFGCDLTLVYGKGQKFPGIKLFAAFIANGVFKDRMIINYGPSISVYSRTLGAHLNPLMSDVQVDIINSFGVGIGSNTDTFYKFVRTMGNGMYYNVMFNQKWAAMLSSNFIWNNHKRHQVNGAITATTPWGSINYCNDGPPFDMLPFADNFDRWWTGSGGLFISSRKGFNRVELTFDQFTGTKPLLYEIANKLGIDVPNYNLDSENDSGKVAPTFNTSVYAARVYLGKGIAVQAGVLGALKGKGDVYYGLQDMIHTKGKYPLHPNTDMSRVFIGGTYNNFRNVKL